MTWHELLQLPETLLWAWRKVRRGYQSADSLYDQAAVAAFELDLEAELEAIRADFMDGRWSNAPIRPIPQSKNPDRHGTPRMRQFFEIAVRDQVAWTAIATVLGPELDRKMPAWSYGNRLYRAAWYEQEPTTGRTSQLNVGPYRHAAGHLYRRFKHSWPLYRRHISLTARKMVDDRIDPELLDEGDRRALNQAEDLPYLDGQHWIRKTLEGDNLFAASFDLTRFYPSIRVEAIQRGFETHVEGLCDEPGVADLLRQMLLFRVDDAGVSNELKAAVQPPAPAGAFGGIPTGLFVGGFLSNVAMLSVDLEADAILLRNRDVAHFRFVDDHEVIAFDFGALRKWIADYSGLLAASGIGVQIEPDKYLPADLKWIMHPEKLLTDEEGKPVDRGDALLARVRREASVNGRKPTQLMTRTLAQVSMLAATDFDLLTDAGRNQRLEQLEWLLLANIPDQEIRGDTRMAFAAARIAMLTPALFRPNDQLLAAHRGMQAHLDRRRRDEARGREPDDANEAAIALLGERVSQLDEVELKVWHTLLRRHFGLLFEAFASHPDKVRLFIRLVDYCRSTGHDGFGQLTGWMQANEENDHRLLSRHLGAIAIHALSRHVATASAAMNQRDLLHRERASARAFLENVLKADLDRFVPLSAPGDTLQRFEHDARRTLVAALQMGSLEVEGADADLAAAMRKRVATALGTAPTPTALVEATQVPIGTWYHWFLSTTRAHRDAPPPFWRHVEAAHDVARPQDWTSLRRYPALLPEEAWRRLASEPELLREDDAGWLIEAARANPEAFASLPADHSAVTAVRASLEAEAGTPTLLAWTTFARLQQPNDPRRSEWTALEIVRQVLGRFAEIGGPDIDELDRLHPENVLIDPSWLEPPASALTNGRLTWDGWRTVTRARPVRLHASGLEDYRYRELIGGNDRRWERRLRPIGQLLWGILRRDFHLPPAWNIRGQERSLVELVAWDLERLPISSFTLKILQACLLPRSVETAFVLDFPSLFGNMRRKAADDAQFDRPIRSSVMLDALLARAQDVLTRHQMTVLEYEPRQLIPVRLQHVGRIGDGEAAEPEELL